jgi:hypothetical protein
MFISKELEEELFGSKKKAQHKLFIVVATKDKEAFCLLLATAELEVLEQSKPLQILASDEWTVLTPELSQQMIEIYLNLPSEVAQTATTVLVFFLQSHQDKNFKFQVVETDSELEFGW